jgi:YHS domain-containing protein
LEELVQRLVRRSSQNNQPNRTHRPTMKKLTILLATLILGFAGLTHAADEASTYPLTTCIVSGEALDSMGKPYVFDYEGQEVQLCCKDCKKKFDKNPEEYMKKLAAAKAGETVTTDAASDGHTDHQH